MNATKSVPSSDGGRISGGLAEDGRWGDVGGREGEGAREKGIDGVARWLLQEN